MGLLPIKMGRMIATVIDIFIVVTLLSVLVPMVFPDCFGNGHDEDPD